ncbi:MAG: biopolymer transporter ExbB [Pseudomonadota bacterium]
MDRPDSEAEPQFALPIRQVTLMLSVIGLVAVGAFFALETVRPVIEANLYLNGVIIGVFFLGVLACFWQVLQLINSVRWIKGHATQRPGHHMVQAPRLLASMAALLRSRGARMQISATSSRSILDSVATRIDEARDITRYIVNLLIFLGLLGTFYGLATTVPAVVETIRSLAPQDGDGSIDIFSRLMEGLEAQLGGMGTAFSSSLLGLAGSLVVGLLELFASHGQNRFYRELEDWLSTITRLGVAAGDSDGTAGDQGVIAAVLDQMAERIESVQRLLVQADQQRSASDARIAELSQSIKTLAEAMSRDDAAAGVSATNRLVDSQERLIAAMEQRMPEEHMDAENRMRLRSIDVQLLRILEEMSAGRQEMISDLRRDIDALSRAVRSFAGARRSSKG